MPHLRGSGALGAPGLLGVGASSSLGQFARCELLELPDQTLSTFGSPGLHGAGTESCEPLLLGATVYGQKENSLSC